ncbi:MAG: Mor transcription activator family protein [bacterium]
MSDKIWLDDLEKKHIPNEELRLVAEYCGLKVVAELLKSMPGVVIYVPNRDIVELRDQYIRQKYDGTKISMMELARELRLSEKTISSIIKKK